MSGLNAQANGDYNKAIHEWQVGMFFTCCMASSLDSLRRRKQAEAAQHCHEGDHDMESNQYSSAAAAYKLSMQLDPSNMEYKTKYDEATQKQQSLDLKEEGEHLMKDGDFEAACSCFQKALQLTPDDDALRNDETAAQHEMQAKKIRDAEAAERAKQLQAQEAERRMRAKELQEQGEAQLESKKYSSAAATLLESLQLDPDNTTVSTEQALRGTLAVC